MMISIIYRNIESHFEVSESKTLWDELDRQGVTLPHGCLAGSCGVCQVYVTSGEENLSQMSPVEADTVKSIMMAYADANGKEAPYPIRLSCRCKVKGNAKFQVID